MRLLYDSKYFRFAIELGREAESEQFLSNTDGDFGVSPVHDQNEWKYTETEDLRFGFTNGG